LAGDDIEVAHQQRAYALPLIIVDHDKGDLGLAGLDDDVASAADDALAPILLGERDQGHMIGEVDIHKEGDFFLREAALERKETSSQRLRACTADRGEHVVLVVGPQRADFDIAAVAHAPGRGVVGWCGHRYSSRSSRKNDDPRARLDLNQARRAAATTLLSSRQTRGSAACEPSDSSLPGKTRSSSPSGSPFWRS